MSMLAFFLAISMGTSTPTGTPETPPSDSAVLVAPQAPVFCKKIDGAWVFYLASLGGTKLTGIIQTPIRPHALLVWPDGYSAAISEGTEFADGIVVRIDDSTISVRWAIDDEGNDLKEPVLRIVSLGQTATPPMDTEEE